MSTAATITIRCPIQYSHYPLNSSHQKDNDSFSMCCTFYVTNIMCIYPISFFCALIVGYRMDFMSTHAHSIPLDITCNVCCSFLMKLQIFHVYMDTRIPKVYHDV